MSITFGSSSAPSQVITNLDALFSQSLAKYSKTLSDNVSSTNAFFHSMKAGKSYEGEDGGTDIRLTLMYALSQMDSYDGYDELGDTPTDGVTQSVWPWIQLAVPITYSMKEVIQNKEKLIDLVDTKINQAEMGFQEGWPTSFFNGAGDGLLATPKSSSFNGSNHMEPLAKLINYTPSNTLAVGNIDQGANTWWRNTTKDSAATTMTGLLFEVENLYNTVGRGVGGPPDQLLTDQVSYELLVNAIFIRWRKVDSDEDKNFPFEYTRFKNAKIMWDEKMHDAKKRFDLHNGFDRRNHLCHQFQVFPDQVYQRS